MSSEINDIDQYQNNFILVTVVKVFVQNSLYCEMNMSTVVDRIKPQKNVITDSLGSVNFEPDYKMEVPT